MIKDLVVNLGLGKPRDVAGEFAISIAEAFGAHACGVAFAYEPVVPPSVMGGIPADIIDVQWAASDSAADAAIASFEAAAKRAGIAAERRKLTASIGGAGDLFGRLARRFDLAEIIFDWRETSQADGLQLRREMFIVQQRRRQYKFAGLHALQLVEQLRFGIRAINLRCRKFACGQIDERQAKTCRTGVMATPLKNVGRVSTLRLRYAPLRVRLAMTNEAQYAL